MSMHRYGRRSLRLVGSIVGVLVVAAGGASQALPACVDQVVGVNERCAAWTGAYNHPGGRGGNGEDIGRAVAASPDGTKVFVTGQSRDDTTLQDQATAAFQVGTGEILWSKRVDAAAQFDTGSAIAVDPAGTRVFVTGRSVAFEGFDWLTTAHDASTGEILWTRRYAGPKSVDDTSFGVVTSPDGETVYVAGTADDGAGIPGDAMVEAYDAATGERRWSARYDGGGYDGGLRVATAADGSLVYLLGTTRRLAGNDYLVAAFEAEDEERLGERVWAATYDGAGLGDNVAGFALSGDGATIAVTGTSVGPQGNQDYATVAIDALTGARRWAVRYDSTRSGNDSAAGVAITGSSVVVTGTGHEGVVCCTDYVTIAYDLATGAQRWMATENSAARFNDTATTISASAGQVFVSGYAVVPRGEIQPIFKIEPGTIMTASYDVATGERRWIAHHNQSGVGSDVAVGSTMSPNGAALYVVGTFITSGVSLYPVAAAKPYAYDMGVVAYPV